MKQKKKKISSLIFLAFLMQFCALFLFCGCSNDEVYCFFEDDTKIELLCGTTHNLADLKIVTNTEYSISWDDEIVDFNQETGELKAVSSGSCYVTLSYFRNNQKQTSKVLVVVKDPVYATDLILEDNYILWVGSENNKISFETLTGGGEYTFDYELESLDKVVFTVTKNLITPQTEGQATLKVRAVSSFDPVSKQYNYVERETTIVCKRPLSNLTIQLFDKNKVALEQTNQVFNLFNGTVDGNRVYYYLKVNANSSLRYYTLTRNNQNDLWTDEVSSFITAQTEEVSEKELFIPIVAKNFGAGTISIRATDSQNNVLVHSNSLNIQVFRYLESDDLTAKATNVYKTKSQILSVLESELTDFDYYNQTEKYHLFKIFKNESTNSIAISDKKYFYGLICFDNFDINCYNTIDTIASNLTFEKISSNKIYFETQNDGEASITISAISVDGKMFSKTFSFFVESEKAQSFDALESQKFNLKVGQSLDLSIKNIAPAYASRTMSLISKGTGIVSISNFSITAISEGKEKLTLSFDEHQYFYEIVVYSGEYCFDFSVECSYDENFDEYSAVIEYEITNSVGQRLSGVNLTNVSVDDTFAEISHFENRVFVSCLNQFEFAFLSFEINGVLFQKTVEIDWENT